MPESGPAGVLHPSWHRVVLKLSGGLFAGAEENGAASAEAPAEQPVDTEPRAT